MTVLIRTRDLPPAQRYDAWRSVVCDTLGPLDLHSDPDVPLAGEIEAGHLGAGYYLRLEQGRDRNPSVRVARAPRLGGADTGRASRRGPLDDKGHPSTSDPPCRHNTVLLPDRSATPVACAVGGSLLPQHGEPMRSQHYVGSRLIPLTIS
jgi:hypothetical protein